MNHIQPHINKLKPYQSASHAIWSLSDEERLHVLKLDWNEATQPPAPEVREAVCKAACDDRLYNLYPPTQNAELTESLCNYVEVPESNLQYFASSDSAHEYIARVFITPGDALLILWPSYDNFRLTAEAAGAKVVYSELARGFSFDEEMFDRDIRESNCSLVYICNPNNPTGTVIPQKSIYKLISKHPDVLFIIDEAYGEFSEASSIDLAISCDNAIISKTMSKAFAMAGFRFGYIVSSSNNISAINLVRNAKSIPYLSQIAATSALSNINYMHSYVNEVKQARRMFTEAINGFDSLAYNLYAYPSGGNFVLVDCGSSEVKHQVLEGLERHGIFVRNTMQSKSVRNCIRFTIGTRKQMTRVLETLEVILR